MTNVMSTNEQFENVKASSLTSFWGIVDMDMSSNDFMETGLMI
jgi:hypothetical protein